MKTIVKPDLKSTNLCDNKSYIPLREKEISLFNFKFYQKLFIVLVSLSIFLIIPESPRELENICEGFNSSRVCNVW